MIPKVIHYCWLSGEEYPDKIKKCIESWDTLKARGYEFVLWDANNAPFEEYPVIKWFYDHKMYAYASDFLRLWACYTYGGIYFDTDVLVLNWEDCLLDRKYLLAGSKDYIHGPTLGCEKGNPVFKKALDWYIENVKPSQEKYDIIEHNLAKVYKDDILELLDINRFMTFKNIHAVKYGHSRYVDHLSMMGWVDQYYRYLHKSNKD